MAHGTELHESTRILYRRYPRCFWSDLVQFWRDHSLGCLLRLQEDEDEYKEEDKKEDEEGEDAEGDKDEEEDEDEEGDKEENEEEEGDEEDDEEEKED